VQSIIVTVAQYGKKADPVPQAWTCLRSIKPSTTGLSWNISPPKIINPAKTAVAGRLGFSFD
jgi:hypothetical protein